MPEDFCNVLIAALYKNKASKSECGNYRGISLLSIAGKKDSERSLPGEQWGFRRRSSTVDKIIGVRQVQEKCIEQDKALY